MYSRLRGVRRVCCLWKIGIFVAVFFALSKADTAGTRSKRQRASCSDLFKYHDIRQSGTYIIDVDGDKGPLPPFNVWCEIENGRDKYHVWTVIHHDAENFTKVLGYESSGSYIRNITYYGATIPQITALIDSSYSCQQYIKWACKGAMFGLWFPADMYSWWVGRNWEPQYYWGGAETDSNACACHPNCLETPKNSTCNCDSKKLKWLEDSGLLLDKSRLPVLQLRFGDTGDVNEAGQYILGPLKCRAEGHKDVFMGSFAAPFTFESKDYPEFYPPPFHRFTWHFKIPPHQAMELVFTDYAVVHWGAYNSVPNCENVVSVVASYPDHNDIIKRFESQSSSPPYFISDGTDVEVNVTMVTCNNDENLPNGKGFQAVFRLTDCIGCEAGTGQNGGTTQCTGTCATIASYKYPFPRHWYTNESIDYKHRWVIKSNLEFNIVELKFNDLDVVPVPGLNKCTPEGGVIRIYDGTADFNGHGKGSKWLGDYCNLNAVGTIHSTQKTLTIIFMFRAQKVGNGRGFHATFRSRVIEYLPKPVDYDKLSNVAEGKQTRQSSTRDRKGANLAVDGNISGGLSGASCSATNIEKEPYWQVDLQKNYLIYAVEIHVKPHTRMRNIRQRHNRWPSGYYALPMPLSGCPDAHGFQWQTGSRTHDMTYEAVKDEKVRHWSSALQLKGGLVNKEGVVQHFCVKNGLSSYENHTNWDKGEYCIFQVGQTCPSGFRSGYIMWIDKRPHNNDYNFNWTRNRVNGTLPKGEYTPFNTTIYFCCRSDGRRESPIKLPATKPFYLLQYGGKGCQKVEGMAERQQFFHFNEDLPADSPTAAEDHIMYNVKYKVPHPRIDVTGFEKGLALYYCYYDLAHSLRGFRVLVDDTGIINSVGTFYDNENYGIKHTFKGNFLQSFTCVEYSITEPEFTIKRINCTQPIYGEYVTIQVHNRYDSLQLCEVKIFGEEACGQPLGMASEEIVDRQLVASSSDESIGHFYTESRLNANDGWCTGPDDKLRFLQIDLLQPTAVTGVMMQGLSHAYQNAFVRSFLLTFSNDTLAWFWEEEPIGQQKKYSCDQCELNAHAYDLRVRYNMKHPIVARYVKLHILTYNEAPCLRAEILGCRKKVRCEAVLDDVRGGNVSSPGHPNYYGQDKDCWWTIRPPPGKHVQLKFIMFEMAPKENGRKTSKCRDDLIVYPGFKDLVVKSPDGINFPKMLISDGPMKLNLKSCFRYSISRFRGFFATYQFLDCPGCGIGDYQCQKIHVCNSSCGHIASFGYPAPYQSNHRCRWLIQAEPTYFINVTFHDFDVVGGEGCLYDYIDFYDGEKMDKDNLIGRYCNRRHPPRHLLSSWNKLLIEFSSDAEKGGRGFYLSFKAQKFGLPPELEDLDFDEPTECLPNWKYFEDHCYQVFQEPETLQWSEAESKCAEIGKGRDGHLVSILSEREMDVLHYLLTAVWKMHSQSLYIGLKDVLREGIYRWSDGNPMSYTDWAQAGKGLPSQPDGGTFQDCTVLKVDSGHSTAQWHDIPCSLGKHSEMFTNNIRWGDEPQHGSVAGGTQAVVQSYICKMESEKRVGDDDQKPLHLELRRPGATDFNKHRYFMCERDKVLISVIFVCDGVTDCKDGSDESNCPKKGNTCSEHKFRCDNNRCISISLYCDFHDDCGDGSDESRCDHRPCTLNEFRCLNQQCIPSNNVCDLRTDCEDSSDEENCAGNCNSNKTFQCFDGTCIPLYAPCDGRRDCPGKYHEDEPAGCFREEDQLGTEEETNSCANLARKTCHDIYVHDRIRTSGLYLIDPDEEEGEIMPFQVHCKDMEGPMESVMTVIHHDTEQRMYVKAGSDGPGAYQRKIVYDTGLEEMLALINVSKSCRQHVRWECSGTRFAFYTDKPVSWWVNRDGVPQYTWGGATKDRTCGCSPNCENSQYPCNCDNAKVFQFKEDAGYLTNKSMLPISEVFFGNTYKAGYSGYHTIGPLECSGRIPSASDNCTNSTKYLGCQSGHYINTNFKCLYQFDQFGYEQGCRDVTHLRSCDDFDCPKDYIKCPKSYCIPSYYICDGKWDCVEGADEIECDNFLCPGHYRCRNHTMCIPLHNLCDGINHCPNRDDEKLCDVACPKGCLCLGLYVSCRNLNATALPELLPVKLRKLDFSRNKLNISLARFDSFYWLSELSLRQNELVILPANKFASLRNLYLLDLRDNALQVIEKNAFYGLKSLVKLYLNNNHGLFRVEAGAFQGLRNLPVLNLTNVNMTTLRKNTFIGMDKIQTLILHNTGIRNVERGAFKGLSTVTHVDIQGNSIESFPSSMFEGLTSLNYLYSDSFKFCCLVNRQISFENCYPPADEISDCEDLMGSPLQRAVIWVLGVIALLGNLFVIIWRIKVSDSNPSSVLILSLGCADFLMGVYLIIIAGVDEHYRGSYMQIADQWRRSALCKVCGILSTVSSEVSVFTLVLITVDRLLSISFPFSIRHLSMPFTYKVITFSWFLSVVLAVVPLIFQQYFQGEFYARSGVCLALHITNKKPAGWEYSVAIFFCVNLVAFVIIVSAYGYMYFTVRKSYLSVNRMKAHRVLESRIAQQMAVIVMTNFLCWFPIIVMGLMAMSGVRVPGHAYAWTAVFVLPLNSATNPLVYTISTLHCRTVLSRFRLSGSQWQNWQSTNAVNSMTRTASSIFTQGLHFSPTRMTIRESFLLEQSYKPPIGYVPLFRFLRDCTPVNSTAAKMGTSHALSAQTLLRITAIVCKRLKELHAEGFVCGKLSGETVFVSTEHFEKRESTFHVYVADFYSYKATTNSAEEMAQDMEDLATLVKKMLRMYHVTSRLGERLKTLTY